MIENQYHTLRLFLLFNDLLIFILSLLIFTDYSTTSLWLPPNSTFYFAFCMKNTCSKNNQYLRANLLIVLLLNHLVITQIKLVFKGFVSFRFSLIIIIFKINRCLLFKLFFIIY